MNNLYYYPEFEVIRDNYKCTKCRLCEKQCSFGVHSYDEKNKLMIDDSTKCVNCNRCVVFCPTKAIKIIKSEMSIKDNASWSINLVKEIFKIDSQVSNNINLQTTKSPPTCFPILSILS